MYVTVIHATGRVGRRGNGVDFDGDKPGGDRPGLRNHPSGGLQP